jgi:acyl dehydratase
MNAPVEGATRTFERTFTVEDVEQFAELSGDAQSRHTEPDDDGRAMVQGLLTATMPTKLGSDSEVLARTLEFEFLQPVYTGEPITCRSTYDTVVERDDRYEFTSETVCENADDEAVLRAAAEGIIWKDGYSSR